jgi:hypothetical protein
MDSLISETRVVCSARMLVSSDKFGCWARLIGAPRQVVNACKLAAIAGVRPLPGCGTPNP